MHAARTHLAVKHSFLCERYFLLRRDLALTIGHGLDRGFGLGEIGTAAAGTHMGSVGGNDGVGNGSHRGCCE